ncbi:co-chaperone GroES [uncultured Campylobacter sp.]|uniref:co-chaperone GroES n=1 Tax=uncultured Campylobacter sp. TaxID=218934 RepID=UPI00260AB9C2|nr:co-chaperone GroES [uncultured Campylobacter sp.]
MNFKPLGKRLLVKREEETKTTASGIIIPDNATKERPSSGKVVAVCDECKEIKVNDTVVFEKYAGNEISLNDEKFLVLKCEDILGIIK